MEQETIVKVCLLAGKIMLQSGAETYRVEDTMVRIAQAFKMQNAQAYATPTAIMFAVDMTASSNFVRIDERATDLHKVAEVNSISRYISTGELSLIEARDQLLNIDQQQNSFSVWLQLLAAAFASGCFTIMFQGSWHDFIPAMIVGGSAFCLMIYFHKLLKIRFFAEFLAAVFLAFTAFLMVVINLGLDIDKIIIGSVMPLVPGLLITNAVRDLMAGHLVSGMTKGIEAILTAFAIGAGVAIVLLLVY
ncbi:threonine/serine exporter family protein [Amphibacillus sp. Q70]|uniref:threonine/serine exporter family protein n=1 Tax=Amphibacillus sp. Q70 TaxID=3453416 RepID=UPI003F86CBBD